MAWYNSDWQYRVELSVDAAKVAADITDYELLVTGDNFPSDFWSNVKSDGSDIVVTNVDGATKLHRDLIEFDPVGKTMTLRIGVPSLLSTSNTVLYLYYGNSSASEVNSTGTYKGATKGYWPLHDFSAAEYPTEVKDRTASQYDAWSHAGNISDEVTAKIGGGVNFIDGDGHIFWDYQPPYGLTGDGSVDKQFSLSFWIRPDNTDGLDRVWGRNTNADHGDYVVSHESGGKLRFRCIDSVTNGSIGRTCNETLNVGVWNKVDITYNANRSDTGIQFYLDGKWQGSKKKNKGKYKAMGGIYGVYMTGLGRSGTPDAFSRIMDEMIIRFETTTPGWISTSYNNENSPQAFYSVGSQEG